MAPRTAPPPRPRATRATARPTKAAAKGGRKPPKRRNILWRRRRGLFVAGLVFVGALAGVGFVLSNVDLPPAEPLNQTTFICAVNVTEACGPDNAMASFSAEEDRINVRLDQVPDVLVQAVLAAEDRDFYSHGAVDPAGVARALLANSRDSASTQGGSTITQQYVKNAYLTSERTLTRKLKEAVLAIKLERELSKDEILERYLNAVYFGRGAYGVGAASRAYFGKDVSTLALPEASYLAGLIRSPGPADASRFPEEASRRRRTVLAAMVSEGYITQEQADATDALPWDAEHLRPRVEKKGFGEVTPKGVGAEYFVEYIRRYLSDKYGEEVLYGGGLRVYTTLDSKMQTDAFKAINSTLVEGDPEAALVAVDDRGLVRAMVGGRSFAASEVNLAVGRTGGGSGRQPGSSFKPFVLAEAIREGISVNSKFQAPARIVLPKANAGKDWKVGNYAGTEQGVLDLVQATKVSSNTVYAQLMLEVGPENVVNLVEKMGIESELPVVNSLVLGSGEVSVLDMASAYSTFANRGEHVQAIAVTRIEQVDEQGHVSVIEQAQQKRERVLSQQESDLVTHCLRGVLQGGTGSAASFGKAAAGKTGTTQDNRDAWFVGYTPKLTAAVWMGYVGKPGEEVRFMDDVHGRAVTGGSFPAEIWKKFMRNATSGLDSGSFVSPKAFPGKILNSKLSTTSSTSSTSRTSSTVPQSTTTTAAPPSTATTATTVKPKPSTTTTATSAPPPTTGTTVIPAESPP